MVLVNNMEVDVLPVVVNNMEVDIHPVVNSDANKEEEKVQTNWSTNILYSTNVLHEVKSVEEIQALMKSPEIEKVTMAGTCHTFNFIADNLHNRLSLKLMNGVVDLNESARTVTVEAGIRYDQLCPYLESKGYALHNLASLTELSIAGAISTSAHGSGNRNCNLATSVSALEMVVANGDIVKLSRHSDGDIFLGAVVGLGALGAITRITLDIEPAFTMRQHVYENLSLAVVKDNFDEIMGSGYSVSLFTNWQEKCYELWIKLIDENIDKEDAAKCPNEGRKSTAFSRTSPPPQEFFGAPLQTENVNLVQGMPPENCTEQMGVSGPSYQRLPHFRAGTLPNVGEELQTEYFVPRHNAAAALLAMENLKDQLTPLLLESEIRTIAKDDLWMSMCYGRDSVAIHFCWIPDWPAVEKMLPVVENALKPYDPRPHWGKLFAMTPAELRSKYEKFDDFVKLAEKFDPQGKFRNEFLNTNVFSR
ncbi:unnamed protein product [Calypogeia fissa]